MRETPIRSGSTGTTGIRHIATTGAGLSGTAGQGVMDTYTMANGKDNGGGMASGTKNLAMAPVGS